MISLYKTEKLNKYELAIVIIPSFRNKNLATNLLYNMWYKFRNSKDNTKIIWIYYNPTNLFKLFINKFKKLYPFIRIQFEKT